MLEDAHEQAFIISSTDTLLACARLQASSLNWWALTCANALSELSQVEYAVITACLMKKGDVSAGDIPILLGEW